MKCLELCAGTQSFSKTARELGHESISVEIDPKFDPTICCDIMQFDPTPYVGEIDFIWASPPCTEFSRILTNRERDLEEGLKLVHRCLEIIEVIKPRFVVFENPVGHLAKCGVLDHLDRHTVSYCKYGFEYQKNTHIWTNFEFEGERCRHDCEATIRSGGGRPYHKVVISGRKSLYRQGQTRQSSNYQVVPPLLIKSIFESI